MANHVYWSEPEKIDGAYRVIKFSPCGDELGYNDFWTEKLAWEFLKKINTNPK